MGYPLTDRPWMTALEEQFRLLALLNNGFKDLAHVHQGARDTVRMLASAATFAWSSEATRAVYSASRSIPIDTELPLSGLPSPPNCWWWFDEPLTIRTTTERTQIAGLLTGIQRDGAFRLEAIDAVTDNSGPYFFPGLAIEWKTGASLSDVIRDAARNRTVQDELQADRLEVHPDAVEALGRFFVAGVVWLQQRIVITGAGPIERHRRKQIAREYDVPPPAEVQVVQLRRAESARGESENAETPWSCRWIVNGHWRNQFHPSSGKHELQYILPYVKGPSDKPLKVPTHTVYAINR